jgi:tRNA-Thr(GGU) m(6)t(6)A37 methyltransferase TsaA
MEIILHPIAVVSNQRVEPTDDFWGDVISEVTLLPDVPEEAFKNIEEFSHLEVIYFFDQADPGNIVFSGRPRGNPDYPIVGIFGQRKKDRPNLLGLCKVELISHHGRTIKVRRLDAINGTPVLDIKPVMREFDIVGPNVQPEWASDLMKNYWK